MLEEKIRNISCTGKHRHETFDAALKQCAKGKRSKAHLGKGMPLSVYKCDFCNGYHIGKQGSGNIKGKI